MHKGLRGLAQVSSSTRKELSNPTHGTIPPLHINEQTKSAKNYNVTYSASDPPPTLCDEGLI